MRLIPIAAVAVLLATVASAQQPQAPGARQGGPGARGGGPFPRLQPLPVPDLPREFDTVSERIRVVPFVRNLAAPWSMAFLPNGDMLVTEKVGRLRIVRNGVLDPQPIAGTPQVVAMGQGGLLDVALHPQFAQNGLVYLTYSKAGPQGNTTALARGRFDGTSLTGVQDIFVADAWSMAAFHFGSRLAFAPDGTLFMTVGERNDRSRAQDTGHHAGKVLRLRDDGTVPADNPFVGRAGFRPEIYSYGHRNMQGLTVHPETGEIWETEHGPQGGDELNLIQAGKNYGWPIVTFGREYNGSLITNQTWREGMEPPVTIWVPSIALSGMVFYTGDRLPGWKGSLFVGGMAGTQLHRVAFSEGGPQGRESILTELRLRVRDVRQGPDGLLYLAIDANPGGAILRIEPAAAPPPTSALR
ncbi:MAG: PQQ-dependent sugar dehydrogenase [Acidobacteria bacterium]|nr:PQQ-dependent sugar dehydrogenase [Acidobacteriota bacterium]